MRATISNTGKSLIMSIDGEYAARLRERFGLAETSPIFTKQMIMRDGKLIFHFNADQGQKMRRTGQTYTYTRASKAFKKVPHFERRSFDLIERDDKFFGIHLAVELSDLEITGNHEQPAKVIDIEQDAPGTQAVAVVATKPDHSDANTVISVGGKTFAFNLPEEELVSLAVDYAHKGFLIAA